MSKAWSGGSDTRWRRFRAAILQRDNYKCQIRGTRCLLDAPLRGGHVDHIIPLKLGGEKYDPHNARAACEPCNTGRKVSTTENEPEPKRVSTW